MTHRRDSKARSSLVVVITGLLALAACGGGHGQAADHNVKAKDHSGKVCEATSTTAYVTNYNSDNVTPIDDATKVPGAPISLAPGSGPRAIAATPDGTAVYVADRSSNKVTRIDTASNSVVQPLIPVGNQPNAIAISPDGKYAYVVSSSGDVTKIDIKATPNVVTATLNIVPPVYGGGLSGIAVTPDSQFAYVTDSNSAKVTRISTAGSMAKLGTITLAIPPIPNGDGPGAIAITPDGKKAYVVDFGFYLKVPRVVVPISLPTTPLAPITIAPISAGGNQYGGLNLDAIAIAPDSKTAYVTVNDNLYNVSKVVPIPTLTNIPGTPVSVPNSPDELFGIALTPDGGTAYLTKGYKNQAVTMSLPATVGPSIPVGSDAIGVAVATRCTTDTSSSSTSITSGSSTTSSSSTSTSTTIAHISTTTTAAVLTHGCELLNNPKYDGFYTGMSLPNAAFSQNEIIKVKASDPTSGNPSQMELDIPGTPANNGPVPGQLSYFFTSAGSTPVAWKVTASSGTPKATWDVSCELF